MTSFRPRRGPRLLALAIFHVVWAIAAPPRTAIMAQQAPGAASEEIPGPVSRQEHDRIVEEIAKLRSEVDELRAGGGGEKEVG